MMPRVAEVFCRFLTGRLLIVILSGVLIMSGACGPRETRFEIVDHRREGDPVSYFERFDDCYYCIDARGRTDVVARRVGVLDPDSEAPVTQVLHIRTIWRAVPGTTYVESTQINAKVSYWILSDLNGTGFEGGGFVVFSENRDGTVLTGKLESSALQPKRRVGDGPDLFERAEVTGQFRAVRDRRRVVRILNEMVRQFGPLPRHDAPPPPL